MKKIYLVYVDYATQRNLFRAIVGFPTTCGLDKEQMVQIAIGRALYEEHQTKGRYIKLWSKPLVYLEDLTDETFDNFSKVDFIDISKLR